MTVIIPGSEAELVPPPKKARVYPESVALGLLPFMKTSKSYYDCRCAKCSGRIYKGDVVVEMPDELEFRDYNREELEEIVRQNSFNGCGFFGCLTCGRRLAKQANHPTVAWAYNRYVPYFVGTVIFLVTMLLWFGLR